MLSIAYGSGRFFVDNPHCIMTGGGNALWDGEEIIYSDTSCGLIGFWIVYV